MTDTDAMLMIGAIVIFALYAAWLWYEAKNAILYPDGTEAKIRTHKRTKRHRTRKHQAAKQKRSRRQENGQ